MTAPANNRSEIVRLFGKLYPESKLDTLAFLLAMPHDIRPSAALAYDERCNAVMRWAEASADVGLARLEVELRELVGGSGTSAMDNSVAAPLSAVDDSVGDEAATSVRAYCRNLEEAFALVDIVGAPVGDDSALPRLEQLYVEQAVSPQPVSENSTPDPKLPYAVDIFRDARRLVVLGDPGGGKSTLVQWITWQFAVANLGRLKPDRWPAQLGFDLHKPILPLLLTLRELKVRNGTTWDELWSSFLDQSRQRPLNKAVLRPFLDDGRVVFLLDGLDEIGNPAARRSLRDAVHDGMRRHSNCRWLLTSRIIGYEEVPFHNVYNVGTATAGVGIAIPFRPDSTSSRGLNPVVTNTTDSTWQQTIQTVWAYYLSPFDDARIKDFGQKWYVCRATSDAEVRRKATDLSEALFREPGTTSLARVPFLLTLMATVHRNNVTLPNGRARLYKLIVDAYVEKREADKRLSTARFPAADQWACLTKVGLEMQLRRTATMSSSKEPALLAAENDVAGWLAAALKQDSGRAQDFLDYLARRTGLLLPRGEGRYGFIHLSFLEFFVAWYLRQQITSLAWLHGKWDKVSSVVHRDELHRYAADPRWHVPLLFVCELLSTEGRRDYLEECFLPALFGEDFVDVATVERDDESRGVLLARLVVDPHAGWDEKAGWGDTLRRQALEVCCRGELTRQLNSFRPWNWYYSPVIAQSLFGSDPVNHAIILEALVDQSHACNQNHLSLLETNVSDLTPLTKYPRFESLNLLGTRVKDLTPLQQLRRLQTLDLTGTAVSDLEPLRELRNLQILSLMETRVTDLSPLARLSNLSSLDLTGAPVSDLSPLTELTGLKSLAITGTLVRDLSPLALLTQLETLSLGIKPGRGEGDGLPVTPEAIDALRKALPSCKFWE